MAEDNGGGFMWFLAGLGLGALVYGLIEAGSLGFGTPLVLGTLAIGVVALLAFLLVEARRPAPMVPLTCVPCPLSSAGSQVLVIAFIPWEPAGQERGDPFSVIVNAAGALQTLAARSGWV